MASFARPGGYDDSSEDEFDGFVFGDSYNCHEEVDYDASSRRDKDFVPSASSLVKKSQEAMNTSTASDQANSELAGESNFGFKATLQSDSSPAISSGGVKFALDTAASGGLDHHDITITKSDSPIKSAHPISDSHLRNPPRRSRGRLRHKLSDQRSSGDSDERLKGQLKGAEESENFRIAVQRGNVTQVKRILENGFDPNTVLSSGWTALMHSCDSANLEVTALLLDHGANPKTRKDQYTALMALCARKMESKGQIETARLLINRGAVVNSHDRHKMSPLLYACRAGHLGLAELLVSVNADVNQQDTRGWTPLHYAASKGNSQLVQLLIESNANPEITCNLGDTPASIAYSNDHTELRDWLESIISSSSRGGGAAREPISLPTFAENKQSTRAPSSDVMMTSSSSSSTTLALPVMAKSTKPGPGVEDVSFGDLELFLKGEQLWQLMPLFREHRVEFTDLLNMTDRDLEQMGISEVGVRKKILSSVAAVHKKEWHMPTNTLPRNRVLSAMEAAFILSNLARHSTYIKATATHLLSHVRSNEDMIGPHLLPDERERLTSDLSGAAAAVSSLQDEVLTLQRELNLALSQVPAPRPNLPRVRRHRGLLVLKVVGGVGLVSCVIYLTGRTLFKYLSS